jgi:hypothetical protein
LPGRVYRPRFRLLGTNSCGATSFSQSIESTGTVVTSPPAPAAVSPAYGGASGSDLLLSWPRDATVTAFRVWRSATRFSSHLPTVLYSLS